MSEKKLGYDEAYSLETPEDSIKLYKKWALTYDEGFAINSNYLSPIKISGFFNKNARYCKHMALNIYNIRFVLLYILAKSLDCFS